jgi:hypothetical protein
MIQKKMIGVDMPKCFMLDLTMIIGLSSAGQGEIYQMLAAICEQVAQNPMATFTF